MTTLSTRSHSSLPELPVLLSTSNARRPLLTPIPNRPNEYLFVVDHSSLEKFITCPLAARNYLVLGREARGRNAPLVFGGAVHSGIESFLKEEDVEKQKLAIVNHFTNNPCEPDYRTPAIAIEVLGHYRNRSLLPDYEWTILNDSLKQPIIERAFELPLGVLELDAELYTLQEPVFCSKLHIAWSGRTDVIAECFGKRCIVDHKTTSVLTDSYIQSYIIASQTIGYVWAAQQLWPELNIDSFCLNLIYLKRPSSSTGYATALTDRGPRGGEPMLSFQRNYFHYSPERIEQWASNTLAIISDFIHCLQRNFFPMHTAWCVNKFGMCPYYESCKQDNPEVRTNVLMSNAFETVSWNPVR